MIKSGLIIFFLTLISYSFYYKFKSNKNLEVEITKPNKFLIEKASKWPIWEKEVSEFDYSYDKTEQCYILEGDVDIITPKKTWSFTAGDFVVFPKGLKCKWKIKKNVRKHYNFIK